MVRTDSHQLRPVAGDSPGAEAIKVVARAHMTSVWECTRHTHRLRHALREHFPAAGGVRRPRRKPMPSSAWHGPDPVSAARLTRGQITAALRKARHRDLEAKDDRIQGALRGEHLGRAAEVTAAYAAAATHFAVAVLTTLKTDHGVAGAGRCALWRAPKMLRSSCLSRGWNRCSVLGCSAGSGRPRPLRHR
ncbi:IS110 family transposase [Rhodococcus sp. USK10]|uniref:IS110 family transposase n=1 Tax=Rhodococcus sp. USK10 TaxID=2789739 RepID=UPI002151A75F|nr:IS110 family transposase [Rhodococcus sp. USK10]